MIRYLLLFLATIVAAKAQFSWTIPSSATVNSSYFVGAGATYSNSSFVILYKNGYYLASGTDGVGAYTSESTAQTVDFSVYGEDLWGYSYDDYRSVTIVVANNPPSVSLSHDSSVQVLDTVYVTGTGSDPDGDLRDYGIRWQGFGIQASELGLPNGVSSHSTTVGLRPLTPDTMMVRGEAFDHQGNGYTGPWIPITVTKIPTTFTFSALSHTYNGSTKTATVTANPSGATYTSDLTKGPNAGSYSVSATATDNYSGSDSKTLVINPATPPSVSISPTPVSVTAAGSVTFNASGGLNGYSWGGSASGSGSSKDVTFPSVGSYSVTVQSPAGGNYTASNTATAFVTVTAAVAVPSITSAATAAGVVGVPFSYQITATNSPTSYGASNLPPGLSVNTSTGVISGTPSSAGARSVTLSAVNAGGTGTKNLSLTISLDNTAPSVPSGLAASAVTATSFTLSWSASTDNVAVTGYEVFRNGTSIGTTTATSLSVTGLTQGTAYSMTVRARDAAANWSNQSTGLNVATIDTGAPSVPAGLAASAVAATSFTLSWNASTDNVAVTGYEVFRNGTAIGTTTATSFSVSGLTQSTAYSMTVRARDAVPNWSSQSTALSVTTISSDTAAPSVPTGLTASAVTATSFTLSWSASTDNVAVTGYEVFRNGSSIGTTTATTFSVTGLTQSTAYSMTVRARDAVPNWSSQSTVLSVTTTTTDPNGDPDGDGISNALEQQLGTNPNVSAQPDSANATQLKVLRPPQ